MVKALLRIVHIKGYFGADKCELKAARNHYYVGQIAVSVRYSKEPCHSQLIHVQRFLQSSAVLQLQLSAVG